MESKCELDDLTWGYSFFFFFLKRSNFTSEFLINSHLLTDHRCISSPPSVSIWLNPALANWFRSVRACSVELERQLSVTRRISACIAYQYLLLFWQCLTQRSRLNPMLCPLNKQPCISAGSQAGVIRGTSSVSVVSRAKRINTIWLRPFSLLQWTASFQDPSLIFDSSLFFFFSYECSSCVWLTPSVWLNIQSDAAWLKFAGTSSSAKMSLGRNLPVCQCTSSEGSKVRQLRPLTGRINRVRALVCAMC